MCRQNSVILPVYIAARLRLLPLVLILLYLSMNPDIFDRLRMSLRALPSSLPAGSSIYNFKDWVPDADALDTYGEECCALNAHLEIVFGHRASAPLNFRERGPGIESIVDVFSSYLTGDFKEKALLEKWVVDLTHAAEAMTETELKQVSMTLCGPWPRIAPVLTLIHSHIVQTG